MAPATILWDSPSILGIDISRSKCCGKATSNGQRCTRDIPLVRYQEARRLLQKTSCNEAGVANLDTWLDRLAYCVLCESTHQHQATELVKEWKRKIDAHVFTTQRRFRGHHWARRVMRREHWTARTDTAGIAQDQEQIRERRNTDLQAATTPSAPAAEAADERDRQNPGLIIRQGAAPDGDLNGVTEQLAARHQVETEEPRLCAEATANEHPAFPATANRREDPPASPITHRLETLNSPPEAAASDDAHSLSGDCPICKEDILDGSDLVCCRAHCKRYFHDHCMQRWFRQPAAKSCPYWLVPSQFLLK